jgi:16S rRNA (guanine527-N7)-methyltransferase
VERNNKFEGEKLVWFRSICAQNGMPLSIDQLEKMDHYVRLLLEWNKKINLISRKDEENIWDYHILHCISPLFQIELPAKASIVDIGTGGGLPGIPLKIVLPETTLLCVDSVGKKANAVQQMIAELNIHNAKTVWGRAEDIALLPKNKNNYDFVVARSVAPLADLIFWSRNFLIVGNKNNNGRVVRPSALLTYKGGDLTTEIAEAKKRFVKISVDEILLRATGTEELKNSGKKFLIIHNI